MSLHTGKHNAKSRCKGGGRPPVGSTPRLLRWHCASGRKVVSSAGLGCQINNTDVLCRYITYPFVQPTRAPCASRSRSYALHGRWTGLAGDNDRQCHSGLRAVGKVREEMRQLQLRERGSGSRTRYYHTHWMAVTTYVKAGQAPFAFSAAVRSSFVAAPSLAFVPVCPS